MLKPIPQAVSNALDRLLSAGVIWRYAALGTPGVPPLGRNSTALPRAIASSSSSTTRDEQPGH